MKIIRLFNLSIIIIFSINTYCQSENTLTTEEKLYGLSLLWKEASYNFAFFHQVPDLNWDSCYQAYLPKVLETNNDWDYYLELQAFISHLQDGHTRVFPPVKLRNKYYGTATKQITTRLIDGKIIITKVLQDSLQEKGLKQGMEIVTIDKMNAFEYVDKHVAPYVFASTHQDLQLQKFGHFLLSGNTSDPISIEVKDFDNKIKRYNIYREPWILEQQLFLGKQFDFEILPENIGYLKTYNFVDNEQYRPMFDSIYKRILETDGMIIDVRGNIGGATQIAYYILRHFTNEPFKSESWKTPNNIAAHRAWGKNIEWYEQKGKDIHPHKNKTIYTKPFNVLCDESSFSGAEDFCIGFLTMKGGKLIGSKTAGSSGSPFMFNIPGGGLALICTKEDFFPDGKVFIGIGISPDTEVKVTIKDIIDNRDPILDTAIADILNR